MKSYNMIKHLSLLLLGIFAMLFAVQTASAAAEPTARRGAQIQITFRHIPAEDKPNVDGVYTVSQDTGCIKLPYIDKPIKAEGRTASQLEESIKKMYEPDIYSHPIVSVQVASAEEINDRNKRYVEVSGYVARKQNLVYRQDLTLMQAILGCGDITDFGSRHIEVTRYNPQTKTYQTQEYDYFSRKDRALKLRPNDSIFVRRRGAWEGRPSELVP